MRYGIPYKGSKSKIAEEIIKQLPAGNRLVDLFGGGFAITHCALVNGGGKWNKFMYNDINPLLQPLITDAINGKYDSRTFQPEWISRDDFYRLKETDGYVKWIWSFGNNGNDYMYSRKIEDKKHKIHDFVVFNKQSDITDGISLNSEEIRDRRLEWMRIAKLNNIKDERLQYLERIQQLSNLENIQNRNLLEPLQCMDYKNYKYQNGDVVYCDIPYEDAVNPTDYGGGFNHYEFYQWARQQPYPVYFSSFPLFKEVWRKEVRSVMSSASKAVQRMECLYVTQK